MWKDVPVLFFFPKTTEKRLDKQAQKSIPIPPLSLCPQMTLKESLQVFVQGVHISCIQIQHFFRREQQWGRGWEERTVGLFVKSFLPAFKEITTHLLASHRSACKVWVDSDIQLNPAMSNSVISDPCYLEQNRISLAFAPVFSVIYYGLSRTRLSRTSSYPNCFSLPLAQINPHYLELYHILKKHYSQLSVNGHR